MDVGNIAELNTFLVLDAIRSHRVATRRQVGRELGLSDASVSRIVKRLLASGIIEELPGTAPSGSPHSPARGRTPSMLRFVGPPGGVIAVDLGPTRCHGALADLAGEILATDFWPVGDDALATLLTCIEALTEQGRRTRHARARRRRRNPGAHRPGQPSCDRGPERALARFRPARRPW